MEWMAGLKDFQGKATSDARVARLRSAGHAGKCEAVGGGVSELKIDHGPGYRVYFGKDGDRVFLLLCGGPKGRQQYDIARAKGYWKDYRARAERKDAKKKKA